LTWVHYAKRALLSAKRALHSDQKALYIPQHKPTKSPVLRRVDTHTHTHKYTHTCAHIHTHTHTHKHKHTQTRTHTSMFSQTNAQQHRCSSKRALYPPKELYIPPKEPYIPPKEPTRRMHIRHKNRYILIRALCPTREPSIPANDFKEHTKKNPHPPYQALCL